MQEEIWAEDTAPSGPIPVEIRTAKDVPIQQKKKKKKKRRRNRRRRNYVHHPLKSAQSILVEMLEDKYLLIPFDKLKVAIKTNPNQVTNENIEYNEIPFKEFDSKSSKASLSKHT